MKRILICSDGSPYSRVCCEYGSWLLSHQEDAQVDIIYVSDLRQFEVPLIADLSGSLGIQPYQAILTQLEQLEKKKAHILLEAAESVFADAGQGDRIGLHHKTGLLVDTLQGFEDPYDLIMLGKRGENANFATEHIGSTVERVVRASTKPCLVTSRKFQPIERVVVSYDGGSSSEKALSHLIENPLFKNLELHLVIVPEDKGEDVALKSLRSAEDRLKQAGLSPNCQMLPGIPEDVISNYVEEAKIDMLLMGAYGHSRIRRLFIGSTTTEMIRQCKIPVMLFR